MIQEKFKSQISQVKDAIEKLQSQASTEAKKVLKDLGLEADSKVDVATIIALLKEQGSSPKALLKKIDMATYEARHKLAWNLNMTTAYAKLQAGKTYARDLKPTIEEYKSLIETKAKDLSDQASELGSKVSTKASELRSKFAA